MFERDETLKDETFQEGHGLKIIGVGIDFE